MYACAASHMSMLSHIVHAVENTWCYVHEGAGACMRVLICTYYKFLNLRNVATPSVHKHTYTLPPPCPVPHLQQFHHQRLKDAFL